MATLSNILTWEILWTEEPGKLQSMGSQRVGHDWSDLARTLRCLQAPKWKFLSDCPSSLVLILSADLPACSSRKAVFSAVSSGFQAQWQSPTLGVSHECGD